MTTITKCTAVTNGRRDHELRKMLENRRRKLGSDVQGKIRDGRDHTNEREVLDEGESAEVDVPRRNRVCVDPDGSGNPEEGRRVAPPARGACRCT